MSDRESQGAGKRSSSSRFCSEHFLASPSHICTRSGRLCLLCDACDSLCPAASVNVSFRVCLMPSSLFSLSLSLCLSLSPLPRKRKRKSTLFESGILKSRAITTSLSSEKASEAERWRERGRGDTEEVRADVSSTPKQALATTMWVERRCKDASATS